MGKSQGNHDETDTGRAQTDRAGYVANNGTTADTNKQLQPAVIDAVERRNCNAISAQTHEQRMPQTNQPTVSQRQVQGYSGDRINHDARKKRHIKTTVGGIAPKRHHHQTGKNNEWQQPVEIKLECIGHASAPVWCKQTVRTHGQHHRHQHVNQHGSHCRACRISQISLHEASEYKRQEGPSHGIDHPDN